MGRNRAKVKTERSSVWKLNYKEVRLHKY